MSGPSCHHVAPGDRLRHEVIECDQFLDHLRELLDESITGALLRERAEYYRLMHAEEQRILDGTSTPW